MAPVDPIPEIAKKIFREVEAAVKTINAETILKYDFVRQMLRMEMAMETEKKLGIVIGEATKIGELIRSIGAEVRKLEIGEEYLKGKSGNFPIHGPYPGALLPGAPHEISDIDRQFAQFDAIDRNLIREATVQVIDLIEETARGRFDTPKLAADDRGTALTPAPTDGQDAGDDVSSGV